jgi:hypothetical protein
MPLSLEESLELIAMEIERKIEHSPLYERSFLEIALSYIRSAIAMLRFAKEQRESFSET